MPKDILTSYLSDQVTDYSVESLCPYVDKYIKEKNDPWDKTIIPIVDYDSFQNQYMQIPIKDEDKQKMDDPMESLDMMVKTMLNLGIPKHYVVDSLNGMSSKSDMTNSTATPIKIPSHFDVVLDRYPTKNSEYIRYNAGSTILPPANLLQWNELLEDIEKYNEAGVPIFISQSRKVRDANGHVCDPWGRSMNVYKRHFQLKHTYRRQTEVVSNHRKEIIVWSVETSLNGASVAIVVWEEVQMAYLRKSTETKFLDSLNPTLVLNNPIYTI